MGILNSIEGPTLPTLAEHVGHPPSQLGWIFTVRSFGFILGSAIPPILRYKMDDMLGNSYFFAKFYQFNNEIAEFMILSSKLRFR